MIDEFATCAAPSNLWPDGHVYYSFTTETDDGGWSNAQKNQVIDAMVKWERAANVRFIISTTRTNRVHFKRGRGRVCASDVGMVGTGQTTELRNCGTWTIEHELGHLLGLHHEHQRTDRDRYITVDDAYFCNPGTPPLAQCLPLVPPLNNPFCGEVSHEAYVAIFAGGNVTKCIRPDGEGWGYGVYDTQSIMHYGSGDLPRGCGHGTCGMRQHDGSVIVPGTTLAPGDGSAVREQYAELDGWTRFKPIVRVDEAPTVALNLKLKAGVFAIGSPALAKDGDSSVWAFARGSDNNIYMKRYAASSGWPLGSWTQISTSGDFASDPAAVSWQPDDMDVVAVRTNQVWHRPRRAGVWVQDWASIGSPGGTISAPTISSWGVNRLDIFVRSGTTLRQKTYNDGWTGWSSRGGDIQGKPAAVSWAHGRIDVIAMGAGGQLVHRPYSAGWEPWGTIGGQVANGTSPAIASRGPNFLDVYMVAAEADLDPGLAYLAYTPGGWTTWQPIGGVVEGSPAATTWSDGTAHVAANILGLGLFHRSK